MSNALTSYLEQHLKFAPGQGAERKANCPRPEFHANGDRVPSLTVNVDEGLLYCFVCGLQGNVHQVAKELGWPAMSSKGQGRRNGLPGSFYMINP